MSDEDPLLFSDKAAEVAGLQVRTWRKYVQMQIAPPPDDGDEDRPAARRMPRWHRSTVEYFLGHRTGQGARSDLAGRRPYALACAACGRFRILGPTGRCIDGCAGHAALRKRQRKVSE